MAAETFAAFGRRVRTSRQAVSVAANVGRLVKSVGVDRRGRRCIVDVELALREWRENSSRITRAPIRDAAEDARPRPPARRPSVFVSPDRFSVSAIGGAIVLAIWLGSKDGDPTLFPLTSATAAELGARLLERAGNDAGADDGETDRP